MKITLQSLAEGVDSVQCESGRLGIADFLMWPTHSLYDAQKVMQEHKRKKKPIIVIISTCIYTPMIHLL